MICSLREDKSGCEKKYRESRYSSTGANNQDSSSSSSRFIEKGIHLIMILLCLLFYGPLMIHNNYFHNFLES